MAKNEEFRIKDCIINLLEIVDEVIVIDNGSSDKTVEIAESLNCKVYSYTEQKLDRARNKYLEVASEEWILVLDADECFDKTAREKIIFNETLRMSNCDLFILPRYDYLGNGKWALISIGRLFRNDSRIRYDDSIMHASIGPSVSRFNGRVGYIDAAIHHLDGLYGSGRMYMKRKRNIEFTLEEIERKRKDDLSLYYLYSFLGLEYAALGDYSKAESVYKTALKLGCCYNPYAQIYLAQNYYLQGEYTKAKLEAIKLINEKNDFKERAFLLLAELEIKSNNFSEALKYCTEIYNISSDNAGNLINIASLIEDSDPQKAMNLLEKAIVINPFLLSGVIYKQGEEMNVFAQQTSFISSTKTIFDHASRILDHFDDDNLREVWNKRKLEAFV